MTRHFRTSSSESPAPAGFAAPLEIHAVSSQELSLYAQVPMRFEAQTHWALRSDVLGLAFEEQALPQPFFKDYDAIDGGPLRWAEAFDLRHWGFFVARQAGDANRQPVEQLEKRQRPILGAAALAHRCAELEIGADRTVLWDLRVAPAFKRRGVGQALFEQALAWSRAQGCSHMQIETQNNNPAACAFYQRMGCELASVRRFAYPELPDEIELLWYKQLD